MSSQNPFSQKAGVSSSRGPKSRKVTRSATSSDSASTSANPFTLAATGSKASTSRPKKKIVRPSSSRPAPRKSRWKPSRKLRVDISTLAIGDTVKMSWPIDPAYGSGNGEFTGTIRGLSDWITVVNNRNETFHYPITTLASIERV